MACLLAAGASAQTTADSEEQRRRAQREAEERLRRQQEPDVLLLRPTTELAIETLELPSEKPCFQIDALLLEGEKLASFAWAQRYLDAYAGQCIGKEGLNLIVKRLSAKMVARGFITSRVGIPEQDLGSKTLRLVLVPGIIRAIRTADDTPGGDWRSAFPVRPGDLLNLRDLEQGLEQLKRVPSQDVDFSIAPGAAPGESDIVISVKRTRPWRLALTLSDSGAKATGRRQASATLSVDNPLGINDLLNVGVNSDAQGDGGRRGTHGGSIDYSVPWGYWTASLAAGEYRYHQLVQGMNQNFVSSGVSSNQDLKLQRLIHRDQSSKTSLLFRTQRRVQHSFIDDTEIQVQRRSTAAAEFGVVHRQHFGATQVDLTFVRREGVPWFGGQSDAPDRAPGTPTYRYLMHTLDVATVAPFRLGDVPMRWNSAFHGQTSKDALYGSEQIAIGNRYTVRGFDGETVLAAERGWYLRNELEFPLAQSGQAAFLGLDTGGVNGPSAQALVGKRLTGAVFGLRGGGFGLTYELFAGWALKKPADFHTAKPASGFQLSYLF